MACDHVSDAVPVPTSKQGEWPSIVRWAAGWRWRWRRRWWSGRRHWRSRRQWRCRRGRRSHWSVHIHLGEVQNARRARQPDSDKAPCLSGGARYQQRIPCVCRRCGSRAERGLLHRVRTGTVSHPDFKLTQATKAAHTTFTKDTPIAHPHEADLLRRRHLNGDPHI